MMYPGYRSLRARFVAQVAHMADFLRSEQLGEIVPSQCEITYINVTQLGDGVDAHQRMERITRLWAGWPTEVAPVSLEGAVIQTRSIISVENQPVGRVYVNLTPSVSQADLSPTVQLEITARGRPAQPTLDSAFEFLNLIHDTAVSTFDAVTTQEMHAVWGKTDA
jgi:hypothetical protein